MSGKRDEDGRSEKTFGETQDRSVRLQQSPVSAGVGHRQGRADSGSAPGLAVRHAMQTSGYGRVVAGRWIGIVAAMMASLDPGIMLTGPYRTGHLQQQTSCQQQPHNELQRYKPRFGGYYPYRIAESSGIFPKSSGESTWYLASRACRCSLPGNAASIVPDTHCHTGRRATLPESGWIKPRK